MKLRVTGEIIRVFEIEVTPNEETNHDALRFRVEIILDSVMPERLTARVWRREFYRIQPTFPQEHSIPKDPQSDEVILVEEIGTIDTETLESKDWQDILQQVLDRLK